MFVREYRYKITEHDHDKPWLVVGQQHRTVRLDDEELL